MHSSAAVRSGPTRSHAMLAATNVRPVGAALKAGLYFVLCNMQQKHLLRKQMLSRKCCPTSVAQQRTGNKIFPSTRLCATFSFSRGEARNKRRIFCDFSSEFSKAFPIAKNHFTNVKMPSEFFCNYFRREICPKESKIECCQIDNIFSPRPKNVASTCVPQQKSDPVILRRRNICCPTGYCRSRQQKNGCAQEMFLLRKQKHEV